MPAEEHYDVLIIGSGAGGASVAQNLADTGKNILILERGEHLPRDPRNWNSTYVFVDRGYRTDELWYDRHGHPFHPNTHYWVGGNTTFYGAALFRLRPGDFEEQSHAGGISPAWPIRYQDLAPYYLEAEKLWRVHGRRGIDPTEPAGEADYFFPALRHDPGIADLDTHLRSLGWQPSPLPLGVMRNDDIPPVSRCIRCETCGGYPCLLGAKADARTISLNPLLGLGNVTLRTNRKVTRLETDGPGKSVSRVLAEGPDGVESYSADIVVLAAGAVNTALILLDSVGPGHEAGLANGSDQVGRNYMFHTMSAMVSMAAEPIDAPFPKTLCVNDFYWGDPTGGFDRPMGQIQLLEHMDGHVLEGQIAEDEHIPSFFVPDFLSNAAANRLLAFLLLSEDLPYPDNRVRRKDGRIRLDYTHGDISGHHQLCRRLDHALDTFHGREALRHHFQLSKMLPLYGTAHMCGTARMGDDPRTSVVDAHCKAHELDNLYITDSSVFVSSAAVNPTLTIVANAWRVGDHLRERLGAPARTRLA